MDSGIWLDHRSWIVVADWIILHGLWYLTGPSFMDCGGWLDHPPWIVVADWTIPHGLWWLTGPSFMDSGMWLANHLWILTGPSSMDPAAPYFMKIGSPMRSGPPFFNVEAWVSSEVWRLWRQWDGQGRVAIGWSWHVVWWLGLWRWCYKDWCRLDHWGCRRCELCRAGNTSTSYRLVWCNGRIWYIRYSRCASSPVNKQNSEHQWHI